MARVLITGAAGGIGSETARLLTEGGHHVVAADLRKDALADVVAAEKVALDITDPEAVASTAEAAAPIEVLVNTVGQGFWSPVEITPAEQVRRAFELNAIGPIYMMQAALSQMRAGGAGTVINLTSASARLVTPLTGLYSAPKSALDFVSRTARIETAKLGIRIMVIEPQFVGTGFADRRYYAATDDPYYAELIDSSLSALKRLTSAPLPPVEVAKLIVALMEMEDPGFRWAIASTAEAALADGPIDDETERAFEQKIRETFGLI
jgi:NAD(P)-dependent dehydrogenase (short-subunit alcohol dehydrogenase family)